MIKTQFEKWIQEISDRKAITFTDRNRDFILSLFPPEGSSTRADREQCLKDVRKGKSFLCKGEFSQLMSDHILRDENGNIILAVVHQETNTKESRGQSRFQKVGSQVCLTRQSSAISCRTALASLWIHGLLGIPEGQERERRKGLKESKIDVKA